VLSFIPFLHHTPGGEEEQEEEEEKEKVASGASAASSASVHPVDPGEDPTLLSSGDGAF
jgi:hypothetical protein